VLASRDEVIEMLHGGRMERLESALAAIDAIHAQDPKSVEVAGENVPEELDYARRMSAALAEVTDAPGELLQIAARAQHLRRWQIPRSEYPMTRPGYHAWRTAQGKAHAALAKETLRPLGYDEETLDRVASLVRKLDRANDEDAQAVEDAACLVFLASQLASFAEGRDEAQTIDVLQKTWKKMSERGRQAALALELDEGARALVDKALT